MQPETPFDSPVKDASPVQELEKRPRGRPPRPRDENGNPIPPDKPRERKKPSPRLPTGARVVEAKPQKKTILTLPLCEKVLGKFYGVEQSQKFINYWKSIPDNLQDAITVHVYRKWPVIDRTLKDPDAKQTIDYIIGACPFISEDWKEDLLKMYGEGDYQLFLNEGNVNVVKALIRVRSNDYPPLLGDYKELVITDPANKSFVNMLRLRGIKLPGDDIPETPEQIKAREEKEEEEKEEMSAADALGRITEKMADQIFVKQNEAVVPTPVPVEVRPSEAERSGIKLVESASSSAIRIMGDQMTNMIQENSRQKDPFEMVKSVIEIAKGLQPPPPPPDQSLKILESIMKSQQEESRALRIELNELRKEQLTKSSPAEAEPERPKTLVEQIQELKEMETTIGDLFGGSKRRRFQPEDDTPKTMWETLGEVVLKQLPTILPVITQLVSNLPTIMHNAAIAKSGTGLPIAPIIPVPVVNPIQVPSAPGLQLDAQTQAYLNSLPPEEAQVIISLYPRLQTLEAPFLKHLVDPNLGGFNFADYLINSSADGRKEYEGLRGVGRDGLVKILQAYPPIFSQVKYNPSGFEDFMKDFLAHDEILMEEENESAEEEDEDVVSIGPPKRVS